MILDDVAADARLAAPLGLGRVRALLHQGNHMVLNDAAAAFVVDMVGNHGALIGELREFARSPFERMTITLPTRAAGDADRETLLLIDGVEFALILRNTATGAVVPIPGWYLSVENEGEDHKSRTLVRTDDAIPKDATTTKMIATYSMARDAIFLLLNQKHGVHVSEPTMTRKGMSRGKTLTFYGRSTVSVSLHAAEELHRHFATMTRTTPRRHAVRGHFVHRGGDRDCEHQWEKLVDRPAAAGDAWICTACDRKRSWRRDFERGDASKGYVTQTWKVTA